MGDLTSGLKQLGVDIPAEVVRKELLFLEELLHWNKSVNLTSIRDLDEAVEKHLVDSLALLPYLNGSAALLDIGSGGGLPGIPLAIARPEMVVTSVDSVGKKINFQRHIKRKLGLPNLRPLHCRIEGLAQQLSQDGLFQAVTARAFSSLDAICAYAAPWLEADGQLLVMKGPEGLAEFNDAGSSVCSTGFKFLACHQYQLPFSRAERQLLVLKKLPV
ncbi:MAG TPA: 16S rRNA (guanine(527)-N(7))-methyltransferase RsmG [Malonomonas sp.]